MNRLEYQSAWIRSHNTPNWLIVKIFLTIIYGLSRIFMFFRVTPNAATVIGGLIGLASVWFVYSEIWLIAATLAALSSLLDGVDGAIAELTNRKSKFGAILDALIDRIVEIAWFVSLIWMGAQASAVVVCGLMIMVMEYTRAKANSLNIDGPGLITIAERPTRVIMFVMLNIGVSFVGTDTQSPTIGVWVLTSLTAIASMQLFFRFTNKLRNNSSGQTN